MFYVSTHQQEYNLKLNIIGHANDSLSSSSVPIMSTSWMDTRVRLGRYVCIPVCVVFIPFIRFTSQTIFALNKSAPVWLSVIHCYTIQIVLVQEIKSFLGI